MAELNEISFETLVTHFQLLGNWEDRYRYILDLAKKLPSFPDKYRTEENRIHGCQSQVWMRLNWVGPNQSLDFVADSDAHLVRGIIAVLYILFQGRRPNQILELDTESALQKLELKQHLSPTRNNGITAMIQKIRNSAKEKLEIT
ncbi:MAG: SufE family protein [FCB group bacterium]|nr:SufE family protein [FCB group bacterium]